MKPSRRILELIRSVCHEGVFPGRGDRGKASWKPDPFHVLISTVLSQRTRDQNTFVASSNLFSEYDSAEELAAAPVGEIERLIRPAGFPKAKAKAIKAISSTIIRKHGGEVPSDIESLTAMPMVGRKTANCVRSYAFHIPSICVDTHVHRISNRIGLVSTKDAEKTEVELEKVVPKDLWIDVNSLMVRFGQKVCLPRNPHCASCPVAPHCDHYAIVYLPSAERSKRERGRRT